MIAAWIVLGVALLAGATAAITSAGIGSMLTPLLALRLDFKVAVAIVAIPHLLGGVVRLIPLRGEIDCRTVRRFGLACAVAAPFGAFLHELVADVWLMRSFAGLHRHRRRDRRGPHSRPSLGSRRCAATARPPRRTDPCA
jgi:uncharacterized membrane protein YfcA